MNRNKLKAYAPQARRDFIKAVTDRAVFYGLTKDKIETITEQGDVAIIAGKPFPRAVAKKRKRLEERIRLEGFEQVMEAMAYTWFNRFVAIRFMELHGYLEHGYRVLSTTNNANGTNKGRDGGGGLPEIVEYAEHVDLPGLNREKVVELKLAGNRDEELYRILLVAQCNALHKAMPFLFEWIGDATELLLPENLLHSDSLIRKMVNEIPEPEWEEVEIIGWLYQFYISEKKDQVIGKVVKSEDIPAATQLFTPNWIVKYMVQNTLGRQWVATYPNSPLKQQMEYYIEPAEQMPEVQEQLKAITPESLNPEELTLLDPACGSGHILVEAYDLLKAIYQERGYRARDIPRLILEKNLYGLEIDDRAAQLSAFALMMKARADDRRIFDNGTKPRVIAIQNSPDFSDEALEVFTTNHTNGTNGINIKTGTTDYTETTDKDKSAISVSVRNIRDLLGLFEHGKTFGSLIRVPEELAEKLPQIADRVEDALASGKMFENATARAIAPIVDQARILARNYDASVTNPPYMGNKFLNARLKAFLKKNYPGHDKDLFSAFIAGSHIFAKDAGQIGFMSPFVWMFISSYEKLRNFLIDHQTITSLVQLEYSGFDGATVPICTFTVENAHHPDFKGSYVRLSEFRGAENQGPKTLEAISNPNCGWLFRASAGDFKKIPGSPIAYWVSERFAECFSKHSLTGDIIELKAGMSTGDNTVFQRIWHEVDNGRIGFSTSGIKETETNGLKWYPCHSGGDFRKWFGNHSVVANWQDNGQEIRNFGRGTGRIKSAVRNQTFYFKSGITWSKISSGKFAARWRPAGFLFDDTGRCGFSNDNNYIRQALGLFCSSLSNEFLRVLCPTLSFTSGEIAKIPFTNITSKDSLEAIGRLIEIGRSDWNVYETSWDFTIIPFIEPDHHHPTLKATYTKLRTHWRNMTLEMQRLEEENNRIFIEAYGLQDELTPDVPLSEITLTCNPHYRYGGDKSEEGIEALLLSDTIKELISYAIGCMMGRYSLDKPGLIYAHSGNDQFWEIYHQKHNKPAPTQNNNHSCDSWSTFPPDQDGIIPINDTDWFPDDAANRFIEFISVAWPKEHLQENLKFVAESLGPNRGESRRETIRRYISTGFFKHHMKMYKKRPIYWLFSSGKLRAFQCLVYLHRYNEGTLSRMRTEYVIPLQGKISARIEQLSGDISAATSTAHRKKLERERDKLAKQQAELQTFDEKLRHYADQRIRLDLDDGVKVNYGKFGDLLAEVKAVTGKKKNSNHESHELHE